jgi:hypothetical protein
MVGCYGGLQPSGASRLLLVLLLLLLLGVLRGHGTAATAAAGYAGCCSLLH